ncbi:MAG: PqqD family protein [Actinomycetota bacterium]|nr:PqqD family protein [Actinomycetota bacterium]
MGFRVNRPSVIADTIEGEVVIINMENGNYFSLDGAGAAIWQGIENEASVGAIVAALEARYDAERPTIEQSVTSLLDELWHEQLITPGNGAEEALLAAGPEQPAPFVPPRLSKYTDMQHLIVLDPVHEVDDDRGWPHLPPDS